MRLKLEEGNKKIKPRTSDLKDVKKRWELYKLPEDLTGKSFLDVGCWTGGFCVETVNRNAEYVLGIDMVQSPMVQKYAKKYDFDFLVCDLFGNKFLELPRFDIVFCAGVLYHVEDPVSFLFRLKNRTKEMLVLETEVAVYTDLQNIPLMRYCQGKTCYNTYSNWWFPNALCVEAMLSDCKFSDVVLVYHEHPDTRACFHAFSVNDICEKILPRRQKFMDL